MYQSVSDSSFIVSWLWVMAMTVAQHWTCIETSKWKFCYIALVKTETTHSGNMWVWLENVLNHLWLMTSEVFCTILIDICINTERGKAADAHATDQQGPVDGASEHIMGVPDKHFSDVICQSYGEHLHAT